MQQARVGVIKLGLLWNAPILFAKDIDCTKISKGIQELFGPNIESYLAFIYVGSAPDCVKGHELDGGWHASNPLKFHCLV